MHDIKEGDKLPISGGPFDGLKREVEFVILGGMADSVPCAGFMVQGPGGEYHYHKLNPSKRRWEHTIGGISPEQAEKIRRTSDKGVIDAKGLQERAGGAGSGMNGRMN